jgi:hypothetical protein
MMNGRSRSRVETSECCAVMTLERNHFGDYLSIRLKDGAFVASFLSCLQLFPVGLSFVLLVSFTKGIS